MNPKMHDWNQNMGKTPIKNQYRKICHTNTVHYSPYFYYVQTLILSNSNSDTKHY